MRAALTLEASLRARLLNYGPRVWAPSRRLPQSYLSGKDWQAIDWFPRLSLSNEADAVQRIVSDLLRERAAAGARRWDAWPLFLTQLSTSPVRCDSTGGVGTS